MKRIVLCGSIKFKEKVIEIGQDLKNKGYEVVIPREFLVPMEKKNTQCYTFQKLQIIKLIQY